MAQVVGSRMYVFGGLGAGSVDEMWAFDLASMRWSPVRPSGTQCPPPRCSHTLTADSDGRIWCFGGQSGQNEKVDLRKDSATALRVRMLERRSVLNDLWVFNPEEKLWREEHIPGIAPSPRRGHTATLVVGRLVGRSGEDGALANPSGSALMASLESSKSKAPPLQELLVLGGAGPDAGKGFEAVLGQLWSLNLRTRAWQSLETTGLPPDQIARFEHTATLVGGGMQGVGVSQTLVVIGGVSSSTLEHADGAGREPSYRWGCAETRLLALDLDTLVW